MQQLSGLDTNFLVMETPRTVGHVCGVQILDPGSGKERLTLDAVRSVVEARLHLLPPFRRRLAEIPFGLDRPYWVEDPDFDLDFHVREIALPPPGGRLQLAEQVARITARPLDRTRPLWELYLIWGLEDDRVAMLTKFHHAAIDGASGREILTILLDTEPEPRALPPDPGWRPEPVPSDATLLFRTAVNFATQPLRVLQYQRRVLGTLPRSTQFAAKASMPMLTDAFSRLVTPRRPRDGQLLSMPSLTVPRTPFNRTITQHRRWAFGTLSLDEVKGLKKRFGVTVNDVVMALCAGALRRWLIAHDALPTAPLVAMVPISVRTEEQRGSFGNRVSGLVAPLPTNEPDPVARLRAAHEAMKAAKEQHQAIGAEVLQDITQFTPPALAARAARVAASTRIADVVNPPFNLVISNVPGPQQPLYLAGARLLNYFPVSIVTDGQGLNITVQSYLGHLDFGLLACRELVPDVWTLMDHLSESLAELSAAAERKSGS
jgi:diacylglycerol O-acyltransferase